MKFCITLVTLFFLFVFPINGVQSQSYEVDVAMVLAVDVSSSVSEEHWELQREGLANAIESNEFFNSVRSGFEGKVAIAVVEWSSSSYLVINWTVVESRNDLQQLAIKIRALNRVENLGTCMAKALLKSAQLLEQWDGRAMKRLIDISGDGANDSPNYSSNTDIGNVITTIRNNIINQNITINGLPIIGSIEPNVDEYYANFVIGGPGAFMLVAETVEQFETIMKKKLVIEVSSLN